MHDRHLDHSIAGASSEVAAQQTDGLTVGRDTIQHFSHRLRSLLTSVGAAARYMQSGNLEPPVQSEMLVIISEQTDRIDALLEDFLVVANARPGARGHETTVDMYHLTRQVVRELASEAQSVGVWLVLDTAGTIPPVRGRRDALRQALVGSVRAVMALSRSGERIVVGLADFSPGPGEALVELTVTVQSQDDRLPARAGGLTLTDLSVDAARRICEMHGGGLTLNETAPGLSWRLPAAPVQVRPAAAATACSLPRSAFG